MSLQFSRIIAGVWKWGEWGNRLPDDEQVKLIEGCIELGVDSFDHADIYGNHLDEVDFGRCFEKINVPREDIKLITKCGIILPSKQRNYQLHYYDTSKDHIIWSVDQSLKNLRTEYLDLLLIHRPDPLMDTYEIAEAFQVLIDSGKVRSFGVSNFTLSQFDLIREHFPIVTNQVEASLLHLNPFLDGTFDVLQKYKLNPMAWSPLGSGKLFQDFPGDRVSRIQSQASVLCEKYECEPDQLYLAWLLKHPSGIFPVLGTSKLYRVEKAVQAMKINISREDWFKLWMASTGKDVD